MTESNVFTENGHDKRPGMSGETLQSRIRAFEQACESQGWEALGGQRIDLWWNPVAGDVLAGTFLGIIGEGWGLVRTETTDGKTLTYGLPSHRALVRQLSALAIGTQVRILNCGRVDTPDAQYKYYFAYKVYAPQDRAQRQEIVQETIKEKAETAVDDLPF